MFSVESSKTKSLIDIVYTWDLPCVGYSLIRAVSEESEAASAMSTCKVLFPVLRELIDKLNIELEQLDTHYERKVEDFIYRVWKDAKEQFQLCYCELHFLHSQPRAYCENIREIEGTFWKVVPAENIDRRIVCLELVDAIIKSNKIMLRALIKISEE